MISPILLSSLGIIFVLIWWLTFRYETRWRQAYHNDERWQLIVSQAERQTLFIIMLLSAVILVLALLWGTDFGAVFHQTRLQLQPILFTVLFFWALSLPYLIVILKWLFLRHYNQKY
ncbi:hypothetical protein [Lapidilactobacillus gannanensis]|jgi:uncharacterized membrane protein|uniref:Uncharacterized protein n=1 Tax=Lapidilactobacillus gannanensis TaxID=2486002 RepID=A0ABW4BQ08_9LACO|nr:hypothetical protein [Lapidilactobacillus gannanensis]MCH4057513.1 hypothetical protein [Lactobacillaceae bacterium]